MNKVITVNLSGRLITIDEIAHQQLESYLLWLKQYFSKERGGEDIYRDMEDRIAELFQDRITKGGVSISTEDVQTVIKIMGSPEEIARETGDDFEESEPSPKIPVSESQQTQNEPISDKKLSRNLSDKVIGGVCSGIASHFKIDPAIVRLIMVFGFFAWGSTLILYILLWIVLPAVYDTKALQLKRRWYRTDEGKMLGGVCAGLSYPLHIQTKFLRLIFGFPLLGIIFFKIIDEPDMQSFCTAALPTLSIVYLVLWIVLPRASSMTQLMEMKGETIDVQNLSTALKLQNEKEMPANNTKQGLKQNQNQNADSVILTIFRVFAYVVLGFVLLIVASILISLLLGLFAMLFGLSAVGIAAMPLSKLIFESTTDSNLFFIAAILLLFIPIIAIIRWLVIKIRRPARTSSWVSYTLGLLFIFSLFSVVYALSNLASGFRTQYSEVQIIPILQPKDTLTVSSASEIDDNSDNQLIWMNADGKYEMPLANFRVLPSDNDSFAFKVERSSNGINKQQAASLARGLDYQYAIDSNSIKLPSALVLSGKPIFRGQQATGTLYVPKGKHFKIGEMPDGYGRSWNIRQTPMASIRIKNEYWKNNSVYKMGEDGKVELVK